MPVRLPNVLPSATPQNAGNVSYVRPEVREASVRWEKIMDCIQGEDAVKKRTVKYLPVPDAESGGTEKDERYKGYINRAVFYNVTGRTLIGLLGQVFARDTVIDLPPEISFIKDDVQGDGVGIEQQAKKALEYALGFGRGGLLVDYPTVETPVSKLQQEEGEARPILKLYRFDNIINWRTKRVGAKVLLSLVVLVETLDVEDDGYETKTTTAYRVLRLDDNGNYTVQLFAEDIDKTDKEITPKGPPITVLDHTGAPMKQIPFTFFGPENNDANIDPAPLYAMAVLNIAHYRNSADYEDSCFIAGQPTPVFSGLTEEWVRNVMQGRVYLGARGGVMLPKGGEANLLQAQGNSMPKEAMEHKEHQMVALGAKLVEERSIRRTATEARQDEASETSILSTATKNVTSAYQTALKWAQLFTGGDGEINFELNSDFDLSNMTPGERQQLVAEWQAEAISFTEMRNALRRNRIATQEDDTARGEIESNPPFVVSDNNARNPRNQVGDDPAGNPQIGASAR